MGKLGRMACIFTPMVLTLASLICFIIVMVGQLGRGNNNAPMTELGRDLYFFKANTSGFTADPDTILDKFENKTGINIDNDVLNKFQGAASSGDLKDFYQIGLWSYCSGTFDKDGKQSIDFCSSSKRGFWFNPVEVWQLNGTSAQNVLGDDMQKGLNVYKKVAEWMSWAFIIAVSLSAVEFLFGILAVFSRWGSFVVTIISTVQAIFAITAASTATATYTTLLGVFKSVLSDYNIDAGLGSQMMSVMWLAVAFSIGSALFWFATICCCSGASGNKKVSVEKTPYTYERVESPAFGQQQQPQQKQYTGFQAGRAKMSQAFEPFRRQQV